MIADELCNNVVMSTAFTGHTGYATLFPPEKDGIVLHESVEMSDSGAERVLVKRFEESGVDVIYRFRQVTCRGMPSWSEDTFARSVEISGEGAPITSNRSDVMKRTEGYEYRNPVMYHRSRDGWVLIAEMGDQHLERAISYFLRKLDDAKRTIEGNVSKFESALYGIEHDVEGAKEMLQECSVKLAGFFYEAVIRGIDITAQRATLVNILGREEAVVVPGKLGRMALDYYDSAEEEDER